jgi:hypothetical protein
VRSLRIPLQISARHAGFLAHGRVRRVDGWGARRPRPASQRGGDARAPPPLSSRILRARASSASLAGGLLRGRELAAADFDRAHLTEVVRAGDVHSALRAVLFEPARTCVHSRLRDRAGGLMMMRLRHVRPFPRTASRRVPMSYPLSSPVYQGPGGTKLRGPTGCVVAGRRAPPGVSRGLGRGARPARVAGPRRNSRRRPARASR